LLSIQSYLGEDGGPDGLNFLDLGGLDQGLELVGLNVENILVSLSLLSSLRLRSYGGQGRKLGVGNTHGDINAIVGEDQRRVGRSELSVRHGERFCVVER
jgi:hypothetical protein